MPKSPIGMTMLLPILAVVAIIIIISAIVSKSNKEANRRAASAHRAQLEALEAERFAANPPSTEGYSAFQSELMDSGLTPRSAEPLTTVVHEGLTHDVEPSFGSMHFHTESSMTGFSDCPPRKAAPAGEAAPEGTFRLSLTSEDAARGFILSEILGKPVSMR